MKRTAATQLNAFASQLSNTNLLWLLLVLVMLVVCPAASVQAQPCELDHDCYAPDSVYYLPFSYRPLSCFDSVEVRLPVYLWTDDFATYYGCGFAVKGARFDTSNVFLIGECDVSNPITLISVGRDTCLTGVQCYNYLTPASGTILELVLRCSKFDTTKISVIGPWNFELTDWFSNWDPLYVRLDTTFVVPSDFPAIPGDVNCSQSVSISDAVFLIKYIFAGGCAPCNPNAADVNASCTVSISDAVYLINYIFAGGDPPLAGCVRR